MAARQLSNLASARNFYLFPIITIACRAENVHYCKMVSWDTLGISHFLFFVLKANKQKAKLKAGWGRSWLLAAGCCPHCTGRATPSCMAPPFTAIRPRPARRPPSPQQDSLQNGVLGWQLLPTPFLCHSGNEGNEGEQSLVFFVWARSECFASLLSAEKD